MSEGAPKSVVQKEEWPTNTVEIDGNKFELGPYLGELNWDDMNKKVAHLNSRLRDGEKPWRILTKDEFGKLGEPIKAIWNLDRKGISNEERAAEMNKYLNDIGFKAGKYWTGEEISDTMGSTNAWVWTTASGHVNNYYKIYEFIGRCVREV
jgi:hypothetical protein